jgi:YjbE family integral membrane protein
VDFSSIFSNTTWDLKFFLSMLNIIFINLILSGDNAVLIAMAVRKLPKKQRVKGIAFGSGAAVLLRIILTFFVAQLLEITFLKLIGGALILWIAVKLFIEGGGEDSADKEVGTLWQAIKIIIIADLTMSLDNVLAVAGASQGNLFLLLFGLTLSIPLVVFTSNLLSILMDKYPIIIIFGAAILGRVGGEMIMSDKFIENRLHPGKLWEYSIQAFFAVGVIIVGKLWLKWKASKSAEDPEAQKKVVDLSTHSI